MHEGITDWLHAIRIIKQAINNSIQESTGLSPAHILYVTLIRMLLDMLDGVQDGTAGACKVQEMQEIQNLVHKRLLHT